MYYVEIALIVAYFVAVAAVGYYSSRKGSCEDYLIAKKNLGVFSSVSTIIATKITASVIISYVALVYVFGVSALWIYVGVALGYVLFLFFALGIKAEGDKHNYYTVADYFYKRYGKLTGKIVAFFVLISFFLNFTIQLIGGAKILKAITGLSFVSGVLIAGGVVLFYLYLGGFKAVVKTDVVQCVAILVLFAALAIVLFSHFSYDPAQWRMMSAGPGNIIPFLVVGIIFPFSAADLWQRSYAAKSVESLKKSFIISTVIYVAFGIVLSLIAIIIKLNLPNIDADVALIEGFMHLLPSGFVGVGIVALFAAIMSTADSFAFIAASGLVQDVLYRGRGSELLAKKLKYALILVVLAGMLIAMKFESILDASFFLTGILMAIAIVIVATWIRKGISSISINFGLFAGLIFTIIFSIFFGISTTLIVVGAGGGLIGLFAGAVLNFFIKKSSPRTAIRLKG